MSNTRGQSLRRFLVPVLFVLSVALLATACGDGGGETTTDGGPGTFDISLGDKPGETALVSFFLPNEFTASAGQEVTFNLSNDGTVPHNMRIAGPDGEYNTEDDTLVKPDILNPGDTAVMKWTAPSEAGTIIFRCDLHPTSVGTITVE